MRKKAGRPATWTRRQLIDGIQLRVRTSIPWRDVPGQYGPWAGCTTCSAAGNARGPGQLT
ncbi:MULTISPECIES: transposase [unclassified Streptomyces]|uniref:transposase n=1 Tax=unclassified Streptomyces TaxID=2593676 RepID=UPI0037F514B7